MLSGRINNEYIPLTKEATYAKIKNSLEIIQRQNKRIQFYNQFKKHDYNSIIPLKIYQTWHTKNLPPLMKSAVNKMKLQHPRFEHFLFDDNDCRNFIQTHFSKDVLLAFDSLVPGAYKADLWRYCVLYINGGIYVDIKYCCVNQFKFIELTEAEHFVLDVDGGSIYNALLVCLPKNEILLKCINRIVENVATRYYGSSCLDPTGPGLLAKMLSESDRSKISLSHLWNRSNNSKFILYKNIAILKMYNDYYSEQDKYQRVNHYSTLWSQRKIYSR